jgi:catechol 2,3-dioxygenase-like lactoylglutathione lyase family enzyme
LRAVPYADDALNLPVADVEASIPFYEKTFGFRVISTSTAPYKSALLECDEVKIGLAENGGDPSQEGCFFEVDDVEQAFADINGRAPTESDVRVDKHGDASLRVFFVIAPDGLCYMLGQRLE